MPNLDGSVHYLNTDVFNAVKEVKNPASMTRTEAQNIKTAILKDGTVDAAEQDLIDELSNTAAKSTDPAVTITSQGTAQADGEITQLAVLNKGISEVLDVGFLELMNSKAKVNYVFIEQEVKKDLNIALQWTDENIVQPINQNVVQPLKTNVIDPINENLVQPAMEIVDEAIEDVKEFFNHVWQYDPSQGTVSERRANCGPASAAAVGENLGLDMPDLDDIRRMVGARRGSGSGAFAISTNQVIQAVEKQGTKEGREIDGGATNLSTNVDSVLEEMRERLENDEQLILLTSNIAIKSRSSLASGSGKGHYVVVNKVNDDGSIVITDPQKKDGAEITHSREQLQTHLQRRRRFGRANTLIHFADKSVPS